MTTHLQRVASARSIVLDKPLYWHLDYRPADLGVVPGVYEASQENALGTFFRGPPLAYFLLSHDDKGGSVIERTDGGLWIPKDGGPAKVWAWFDSNHKVSTQVLGRQATPNEVFQISPAVPTDGGSGRPAGAQPNFNAAASQVVNQRIALGQVPGGVAGGAAAGVGAAVGGAIAGALWKSYIGMRDVILFDPPTADDETRRQLKGLTQTAANALRRP